jgi:ATP-dependent DNA helicase RecG
LQKERIVSRRYRNRRIGDFLKELDLTEGRSTGIPKIREAMAHNGSPAARLITDEERTYFRVELPIHPAFLRAPVEVTDEDIVEVTDEDIVASAAGMTETERCILKALRNAPLGRADLLQWLGYKSLSGHVHKALDRLGLIALTVPEKPQSKRQRRRLTELGKTFVTVLDMH